MKLNVVKGTTSKRIAVFILDSTSTVGAGKTGLTNASMTWYYWREDEGNAGGTSVSVVSATRGTFTSGGFIEKDATNLPGMYELGLPNAALASGANWVTMMLRATGIAPLPLEIQLIDALQIKKNAAFTNFEFLMVNSTDHITPQTGLTITATRSIDGGAFAACSNSATELSAGIYKIDLSAADLNGNFITLKFTATGADARYIPIATQA